MQHVSRRALLRRSAPLAAAALWTPGVLADLLATPPQTPGPFYPNVLPLDTDNDLLIINDSITPAVGEITHLTGTVTDTQGNPLRNATVEIWQVDANAAYIHTADPRNDQHGGHFQGYGRFLTDHTGQYYFRTIKPVAYPGRTPHIHVAVSQGDNKLLTTQCYVAGEPANQRDGVLQRIRNEQQRAAVQIDFAPLPNSDTGELAATFDMAIGLTPQDPDGDPQNRRGTGQRGRRTRAFSAPPSAL